MAFDGITMSAVIAEFQAELMKARVDRIYQTSPFDVLMIVRSNRQNRCIFFSVAAGHARFHFTQTEMEHPPYPPAFCMLLRKHLLGARIVSIEQEGLERVARFVFEKRNLEACSFETDDEERQTLQKGLSQKDLMVEIMGKHSNLILVSQEAAGKVILGAIKPITRDVSRHREILPGRPYVPAPSQGKLDPLDLTETAFEKTLAKADPESRLARFIVDTFLGISPLVAQEIVFRAGLPPEAVCEGGMQGVKALWQAFDEILSTVREAKAANLCSPHIFTPVAILDSLTGAVRAFSCIDLRQFRDRDIARDMETKIFPTISELLDFVYEIQERTEKMAGLRSELIGVIKANLERCGRGLSSARRALDEAENADEYRIMGELIAAQRGDIKPGQKEALLTNYYDPNLVKIMVRLDPALSPQANAEAYFKKYAKAKRAQTAAAGRARALEEESTYMEQVKLAVAEAVSPIDLTEIKEELISQNYIKKAEKKGVGKKAKRATRRIPRGAPVVPFNPKPSFTQFMSGDGYEILVGRNNVQNDRLLKVASPTDIWLHARGLPGSHVIVRTSGEGRASDEALLAAAALAAFHSKGRGSTTVPVDYTLRKHVRKPTGARPGMVIYENEKTIFVAPDPGMMGKLIQHSG